MRTTSMIALKGGVGKSTSVFHLSAALASKGNRVLIVDNDPQSSLTQGFWGTSGAAAVPFSGSVASLYVPDSEPLYEVLLAPTGIPGVTLVPGSARAAKWNRAPDEDWPGSQWGLRKFLDAVSGDFDLCLIDCPPNLYLCSWAALLASQFAVVPLQPEDFGSQGLGPVMESYEAAREFNPELRLAGYLLTMVAPRTAVHQTYEAMIREHHGGRVFSAVLPRMTDFPEAVANRQPVTRYKPRSAASKAVQAVAAELIDRMNAAVSEGEGVAA